MLKKIRRESTEKVIWASLAVLFCFYGFISFYGFYGNWLQFAGGLGLYTGWRLHKTFLKRAFLGTYLELGLSAVITIVNVGLGMFVYVQWGGGLYEPITRLIDQAAFIYIIAIAAVFLPGLLLEGLERIEKRPGDIKKIRREPTKKVIWALLAVLFCFDGFYGNRIYFGTGLGYYTGWRLHKSFLKRAFLGTYLELGLFLVLTLGYVGVGIFAHTQWGVDAYGPITNLIGHAAFAYIYMIAAVFLPGLLAEGLDRKKKRSEDRIPAG